MDPRERADAALARARARGPFVVTPESAISPMDAANTLQLPRIVISDNDAHDPDATVVVPLSEVRPEENIPAIAQEALTDVVGSPPGIRSRQRRLEDAIARGVAARQQKPDAPAPAGDDAQTTQLPTPAAQPEQPTASDDPADSDPSPPTPPTGTGILSQRLDG